MSNPLTTFIFEGASIRVFGDSVSPLFVAADICNALNLTNPSMAIASLAPFERAKLNLGAGKPDVNVVNESGLYTLILRSRDAVKEGTPAYRFRVKVTNEILARYPQDRELLSSHPHPRGAASDPQGHLGARKEERCRLPDDLSRALCPLSGRKV